MKPRVAITGAGGFLGRALVRHLLGEGAEVHALTRQPPANLPGLPWHPYDLAGADFSVPENVDTLVHAAFGMDSPGPALEQLNRTAAQRLQAVARQRGLHFIFISSMSAHEQAVSSYGRAKWEIEQTLDPAIDTIVRPGLIIGPGGVYARMYGTLRRAPVLPLFFGGVQPVQPVGLDEVVKGLAGIIAQRMPGVFNLGAPEPMTIRALYRRMLAAAHLRRPMLPLPGDLMVHTLRACESLGLRLPLTSENLLGQKYLRRYETSGSLARLGLIPTPLDELPWAIPASTP